MASGSQKRFMDWEERFVSHDRGSRVVHYYLRDRHGRQCLAVIGTERSLRHMVYVVCDDFLPLAGLDRSTTSAFKWRARREVVDWLSSLLTKTRSPDIVLSTGSPNHVLHPSTATGSPLSQEGAEELDIQECRSRHQHDNNRKHISLLKADVVWVGSAWSCRKRLQHFHSFRRNGIMISVQDFVYVMTEEKDRHIAYVEDLFEDKKLRKKLRVRWFHKTSELRGRIPSPAPNAGEVFYTTFQQDLSVECIDGVATVLTPQHHDICLAMLPADTMAQALICYRQFDSEGIKHFNLQEVKGYWQQTVLLLAGLVVSHENSHGSDQGSEDLEMDEEDGADPGRLIRRGPRTARCSRRRTGLGNKKAQSSGDGAAHFASISGEVSGSGSGDIKYLTGGRRAQGMNHDQEFWRYDVGDHVEMLSEDSGLRGCWFKGTILRRSLQLLKVRYDDVLCEDGKGNLEEWMSSCKIAGPCKFGIRTSGRPTIRPCPPDPAGPLRLNKGEVVDAWWHDGWWEGILCGKGSTGQTHVFIPGELETAMIKSSDLRVSKEWLSGRWAAVPSYPGVVLLLGLSVPFVNESAQRKEMEKRLRQFGDSRSHLEPDQKIKEERFQSPAHIVRLINVVAAVNQKEGRCRENVSIESCVASIKEEKQVAPGTKCVLECEDEQNFGTPGSPRSGHPSSATRLVLRNFVQESQNNGTNSDVEQSLSSKLSTAGLKWKVGRKRQRQGESLFTRVERISSHSVNVVKEFSPDSSKEEVSSDENIEELAPLEELENLPRWKSRDGEDMVKLKKSRHGNDSSMKALHGSAMGSSLFIGSMPMANLVMSR